MQNNNCFIEFDILEDQNFIDLLNTFNLIKEAKNSGNSKNDKFWIENFPKYSIEKFYFLDSDIIPDFKTSDIDEFTWHFYSLIELLVVNYEIEYIDCLKIDNKKGIIIYDPYSYPYGGVSGLITFIKSFNCIPTRTDDGTGIYNIYFKINGDLIFDDANITKSVNRFKTVLNYLKRFFN